MHLTAEKALRACHEIAYDHAVRILSSDAHRDAIMADHLSRQAESMRDLADDVGENAIEAEESAERFRVASCSAQCDLSYWLTWGGTNVA